MATMKNKVIWREGTFVQPQHFQQQQRHNNYLLTQRLSALGDFAWGFTELSINTELLAQGRIALDKATGCMADGTVFSLPEQDYLPQPFQPGDLSRPGSHDIYLALPVISDVVNEIEGHYSAGQSQGRYRLNRVDVRDLHTDGGESRQLELAQLVPRIMSGAEDLSAYTVLPLCRIRERQANGELDIDPHFIPTCQVIRVSPVLQSFIGELKGLISNRSDDLAKRIGSPEQSGIADIAEFMMLQLLNHYRMYFTHYSHLHSLHPEVFYRDLTCLLGELMTFTDVSRQPCPVDVYDHRNLTKSFQTVIPELRRALNTVLTPRAQNLPLRFNDGIWMATVNDPSLLQTATFILAVRARIPHDKLRVQFIQQSKISSSAHIRNVVSVQVPGIPLRSLTAAPRQLPYHEGYVYFELDKTTPAWQDVIKASAFALHISGQFPDLDLQLWAVRG